MQVQLQLMVMVLLIMKIMKPSLISSNPLNAYGYSKHFFDRWVQLELAKKQPTPPQWCGLKFFNVYGPNEYHKGRMASVVFHAFNQFKENKQIKLFKSEHPSYADGMQVRDFIYVKDAVEVIIFFLIMLMLNFQVFIMLVLAMLKHLKH